MSSFEKDLLQNILSLSYWGMDDYSNTAYLLLWLALLTYYLRRIYGSEYCCQGIPKAMDRMQLGTYYGI